MQRGLSVIVHPSVFLSGTSDSEAKEGGVGEETEKGMDGNKERTRGSKAVGAVWCICLMCVNVRVSVI